MKNVLTVLLAALVTLALLPTCAPGEDNVTVKKELGRMQGEWTMVSGVADGYPMPDAMLATCKRVCKADVVTTTMGKQVIMKAKITIDPAKSPKTIDYEVIDGPTKGKKHLGIYKIDGDKFKSCFAAPGADRPTDFASKQGDQRTYSVWKRGDAAQKDEKK